MEEFFKQAKEKLKTLVTCEDASRWKNVSDELFLGISAGLAKNEYFLFAWKLDDYAQDCMFYHLINISFLSLRVAKKMDFTEERQKNLVVMCLLCDKELFKISDKFWRQLFKDDKDSNEIIKLADIFDTVINPPAYRKFAMPWAASEAIKDIVEAREDIFDPKIVGIFFKTITVFPVGSWVLLANGFIGKVKNVHSDNILRPQVEIVAGADGAKLEPYLIDLASEPMLNIKDCLSDQEVRKRVPSL